MEVPNPKTAIESNRQAWNDSARHHQDSPDWQALLSDVAQAEFCCLDDTLRGLLEVDVKDVIQLGCNNGRESLSLFALGARSVVGVDQSAAFLEQARELNSRSPHTAEFIESDIHRLPPSLHDRFDVALITIGVLNWMPDIGEFFRHVAQVLKPGGKLVIYETHPFLEMVDPQAEDPLHLVSSYFRAEPFVALAWWRARPENLYCDGWPHREQARSHIGFAYGDYPVWERACSRWRPCNRYKIQGTA